MSTMEDLVADFFVAVQGNNLHFVKQILNQEYTDEVINASNEDGKSALQVALEYGCYGMCVLFLSIYDSK